MKYKAAVFDYLATWRLQHKLNKLTRIGLMKSYSSSVISKHVSVYTSCWHKETLVIIGVYQLVTNCQLCVI